MSRGERPRLLVLGALLGVVLVAGGLVTPHLRHGWPFSLHHAAPAPPRASPLTPTEVPAQRRAPVALEAGQLERFAIRTEVATRGPLRSPVRAVATVVPDESRVSHVHTRVSGWLERLFVNTTGQAVKAGQPLAAIFSQELFASQVEYLAARRASQTGPASLIAPSARTRLEVLGMTEAEIAALERRGTAQRLVTLVAPRSGVVLRRGIAVGTAVDPSTEIVTVADLSRVWVLAELTEGDGSAVRVGTPATLEFPAARLAPLQAEVAFVYPTLTERTRTLRVRFELSNERGTLRPGLYGAATFEVDASPVLTVARDALVDTGPEQFVFVETGPGRFEPRRVRVGQRAGDRVEIVDGLADGERVVASGVFLVDSESRLRASSGGTGHVGHGGSAPPADAGTPAPSPHQGHGG